MTDFSELLALALSDVGNGPSLGRDPELADVLRRIRATPDVKLSTEHLAPGTSSREPRSKREVLSAQGGALCFKTPLPRDGWTDDRSAVHLERRFRPEAAVDETRPRVSSPHAC